MYFEGNIYKNISSNLISWSLGYNYFLSKNEVFDNCNLVTTGGIVYYLLAFSKVDIINITIMNSKYTESDSILSDFFLISTIETNVTIDGMKFKNN